MTNNEMILRLLAENFSLKDQIATALKKQKESDDSSMFWYRNYSELKQKTDAKTGNDDIPLTPEGLKNKCDMKTD